MKIEEFVVELRRGGTNVRIARAARDRASSGTAANMRATIDHRRECDALSMLINDHPDLVARILVRAWETAEASAASTCVDGELDEIFGRVCSKCGRSHDNGTEVGE